MNRAQARQMYLSMNDDDFDNLARKMTRWQVQFWTMVVMLWIGGMFAGIGIALTWLR